MNDNPESLQRWWMMVQEKKDLQRRSTDKIKSPPQSGCISVGRIRALDARGRKFESCHPDNAETNCFILRKYSGLTV